MARPSTRPSVARIYCGLYLCGYEFGAEFQRGARCSASFFIKTAYIVVRMVSLAFLGWEAKDLQLRLVNIFCENKNCGVYGLGNVCRVNLAAEVSHHLYYSMAP